MGALEHTIEEIHDGRKMFVEPPEIFSDPLKKQAVALSRYGSGLMKFGKYMQRVEDVPDPQGKAQVDYEGKKGFRFYKQNGGVFMRQEVFDKTMHVARLAIRHKEAGKK